MRSEKEIREALKKDLEDKRERCERWYTKEFPFRAGWIRALKWVLGEEER